MLFSTFIFCFLEFLTFVIVCKFVFVKYFFTFLLLLNQKITSYCDYVKNMLDSCVCINELIVVCLGMAGFIHDNG